MCLPYRPTQITLLLVGINNAGKTTLLNSLQGDLQSDTVPTYGFNAADICTPKCSFKVRAALWHSLCNMAPASQQACVQHVVGK